LIATGFSDTFSAKRAAPPGRPLFLSRKARSTRQNSNR
jgi:hypothetical protein